MIDIHIARQPIFTRSLDVVGYELLYHSPGQDQAGVKDSDQATMQVILNAFSEIGMDTLIGKSRAFINLSRNFIIGKLPIPLPPDRVIFEIPESTVADPQLLDALRTLARQGYELALDDVTSALKIPPYLGLMRIMKVNIKKVNRVTLPQLVYELRQYPFRLLAEKVETQEEFNLAIRLGFDYLQGYFLCKPSLVSSRTLDPMRLVVLRSLSKLQDPKASFESLEAIVAQDPVLSYKLIRLINSAYYSLNTQVKSLRQAISLIGINNLRGWISLLLMTNIKNKPHELSNIALQRAKMAEGLARAVGEPQVETYFLAGLFSTLDAMMDMPMDRVLANIPLSDEVMNALLTRQGKIGAILNSVISYELGNWEPVTRLNIKAEKVNEIYLESIHWAQTIIKVAMEEK